MKRSRIIRLSLVGIALSSAVLVGCSTHSATTSTNDSVPTAQPVNRVTTPSVTGTPISQKSTTEKPIAPENNPPGDIPDNQAFITYNSLPGSYKLEVPEGWARQTEGKNVNFTDKLDGVQVTVTDEHNSITAATVKTKQVAELQKSGRAVEVVNVKDIQLPSGKAVLIEYTSNSEPNAVTGKTNSSGK